MSQEVVSLKAVRILKLRASLAAVAASNTTLDEAAKQRNPLLKELQKLEPKEPWDLHINASFDLIRATENFKASQLLLSLRE